MEAASKTLDMTNEKDIASNLSEIEARLHAALDDAGRGTKDCLQVAVSKTKPAELIRAAVAAGQTVFGENKIQVAEEKWPAVKADHPHLELRMICPLQSNKVRKALQLFDVIETVDRPKLARAIARIAAEEGPAAGNAAHPLLYVQVNTGDEPQKAGISPAELPAFLELCRGELGLKIEGLMCIPPHDEEPAMHFELLEKLARDNGVEKLSMGMSSDFEVAARLGATSVRVGTAIFGARNG